MAGVCAFFGLIFSKKPFDEREFLPPSKMEGGVRAPAAPFSGTPEHVILEESSSMFGNSLQGYLAQFEFDSYLRLRISLSS